MKNKNKNKQKRQQINSEKPDERMVIGYCLQCKIHVIFPKDFEVPPRDSQRCQECGNRNVNFYEGRSSSLNVEEALKGGMYKMADKKKEAAAKEKGSKKPKKEKAEKKAKKSGEAKVGARGYDDSVKQKVVDLGKQGKTVSEIVKAMGADGPKTKAVVRYLKSAGVKDVKRK